MYFAVSKFSSTYNKIC